MHEDAKPSQGRWKRLKKAGRWLAGVTKESWEVRAWDNEELQIDVHVDSDWAGGPEMKSTSGGMTTEKWCSIGRVHMATHRVGVPRHGHGNN